jgi:hypothetical protein
LEAIKLHLNLHICWHQTVLTAFCSKTDALNYTLRIKPTSSLNAATAQEKNSAKHLRKTAQPSEAYIKLKFNFGLHRH